MPDKGIRARKDMWETKPFQKVGCIAYINASLHWMDDLHEKIRNTLRELTIEDGK